MFPVTLTTEQKVKITANPVTAAGNPATLDGPIRGTVVSGDATVEDVPGEPNSLYIVSGTAGASQIAIEADADLGAGARLLTDEANVTVTPAEASSLGFTVGTPEPK